MKRNGKKGEMDNEGEENRKRERSLAGAVGLKATSFRVLQCSRPTDQVQGAVAPPTSWTCNEAEGTGLAVNLIVLETRQVTCACRGSCSVLSRKILCWDKVDMARKIYDLIVSVIYIYTHSLSL